MEETRSSTGVMRSKIALLTILLILFISTGYASASRLYMRQKNIDAGTVEMHVFLDPTDPIRGWEFKVHYDAFKLHVSRVSCSNISNHTFSHPGTYNNSDGTLIDVYGVILGPGNITSDTEIAVITFSIIEHSDSEIRFVDAGICNWTRYMPCSIINGSVHFSFYRIQGWNSFFNDLHWMTVIRGWSSLGNASLSPDNHGSGSRVVPQRHEAPISDHLAPLIGSIFAAILITGMMLSLVLSFKRRK